MVVQVCDAVNLLISYQLCNLGNKTGFVYQIWKFCDNNSGFAVWKSFDVGHCTYTDLSASGSVGFFDSSSSKDSRTCREIRTFYNVQDFLHGGISLFFNNIVDNFYNCIYYFFEVMRWNIGRHTYGNTGSSVYQKVRITGRQYNRLSLCLIEVWLEVNRVFVDICQHFHGNFAQTCFSVSHGCCPVTIY